jgi:hypothetical protein
VTFFLFEHTTDASSELRTNTPALLSGLLEPGEYRLTMSPEGFRAVDVPVRVVGGATVDLEVSLVPP